MLKLRLARVGRRKHPAYRIVVADADAPRDGRFVEIVGQYDPLQDPPAVTVAAERIQHWLTSGAQPTETVHRLLAGKGLIAPFQPRPRSKKTDAKHAKAAAAAAQAAAAKAAS